MYWRELFEQHILVRGKNYFNNGLVLDVAIENDLIEATVLGSKEYNVSISQNKNNAYGMECNCPYALDGHRCKHMAAVLYFIDGQKGLHRDDTSSFDVVELVSSAPIDSVRSVLITILAENPNFLHRYTADLNPDMINLNVVEIKENIDKIFYDHSSYKGSILQHDMREFIIELEVIIDNTLRMMLDHHYYDEAFQISTYIYQKSSEQDMDDWNGDINDIADRLSEAWSEILLNCSAYQKQKMFQWFISHMYLDEGKFVQFYIENIVFRYFNEEIFLLDKLKYLDEQIQIYKAEHDKYQTSHEYKLGGLMMQRISLLTAMKVSEKEIDQYCLNNFDIKDVRDHIIEKLIIREDYKAAIDLLKKASVNNGRYFRQTLEYRIKLKDIYKAAKQDDLYMKALWTLVTDGSGEITLYKELKSNYTKEEWLIQRENIFNEPLSTHFLSEIFKEEELYDRLIRLVINHPNLSLLLRYEADLKAIYPDELLRKYVIEVEEMAQSTRNRSYYQEITVKLHHMLTYPNGQETVSRIVQEWKAKYKHRPAMIDELKQFKSIL